MEMNMRNLNDPSLEAVISSFSKHIQEGGGLQHTADNKLVAVSREVFAGMDEADKIRVSDDLEKLKEIKPYQDEWVRLIDSIAFKLFGAQQTGAFTDIPDEVFVHMLSFIEPDKLFKLKYVSRKWNELAHWAEIEVFNSGRKKFSNYFPTPDKVLNWLKKNPMYHKLKVADFSNFLEITDKNLTDLLALCKDLRLLSLQNCKIEPEMRNACLTTIATSHNLKFLETLNLSGLGLDDNAITTFAQSTSFPLLKNLFLARNAIGPRGAASLANSPLLKGLDILLLSTNPIGPNGIKSLVNSENVIFLKRLYLAGCNIGDEGASYIAKSKHLRYLIELNINFNGITAEGADQFAQAIIFTQLEYLDISTNRLGKEGKESLQNSKNFPSLKTLKL